jgi:hypothetical protein
MTARAQRGSRVIYVAASARELPQPVQDWLSGSNVRATASSNIYDALAVLASGQCPLALIVSMEAVDWSELDFFVHARRVSPETVFYVAGAAHQEAKIEEAIARGARRFEAEVLSELLTHSPAAPQPAGPAGLLAGSLRTDVETPPPAPRLVRPETPAEPPATTPEEERPAVRLVSSTETEEIQGPAVPFPWSPAPGRPQRTPPQASPAAAREPKKNPPPAREPAPEGGRRPPVKLTPDELAALREQPPAGEAKRQEGGT